MISEDFTKDVTLLDYEKYEYASLDVHETGINTFRMHLPERYDLAKRYKHFRGSPKRGTPENPERGEWVKKKGKEKLDFSDDFNWQITYSFPSRLHNNITSSGKGYGGAKVTLRRLYLILCERFNKGEYFIDTYFHKVYPYTVKSEVDAKLQVVKKDLTAYAEELLEGAVATKEGKLDKRLKVNKEFFDKLRDYATFKEEWENNEGNEIAYLIKEDIKRAVANGEVPLHHVNTAETKRLRIKAGLFADPVFYATGDLVDNIQLYVNIGGNKKWQTKQGIMV